MEKIWLDDKAKLNVVRVWAKKLELFPQLVGNAVIVSDRAVRDHLLTSAPVVCLRHDFYHQGGQTTRLASDSDFLSDQDRRTIDDRGLIRPGTAVSAGAILAAAVGKISGREMTVEEQMLRAIFGRAGTDEKDCSIRYDLDDPGTVIQVRLLTDRQHLPLNVAWRVEVEIVVRRELQVGDTLSLNDEVETTVASIMSTEKMFYLFRRKLVDILVGPDLLLDLRGSGFLRHRPGKRWRNWFKTSGEIIQVTKKTQRVEEKLEFRSTGAYSLLGQQPMGSRPNPAQPVPLAMIQNLLKAGYPENARELLTIKADAIEGRTKAYEALVKGQPVPLGVPWSIDRLELVLRALGFALQISADSLKIAPLSDNERRALSHGQVKSDKIVNYRNYRFEPDGLFCERIFGPDRDWECHCGKYKGTKFKGLICDKCGVQVTTSRGGREWFGHIVLAKPAVHLWFLSKIAQLLGMEPTALRELIYEQGGADEVKSQLETLDVSTDGLVMETLLVLPPDLRPLVQLENGQWTTADLNDLYRRVINRSQRLGKLVELEAPPVIINNETRMLQLAVDAVIDNAACPRPVLGENDRPLHSLKEGLARAVESISNKRSDFSAKAVAVPDKSMTIGTIGLPLLMAIQLFLPILLRALKESNQADTIRSARHLLEKHPEQSRDLVERTVGSEKVLVVTQDQRPIALTAVIRDGECLRLNPQDARALGLSFANSQLRIYPPWRPEAKDELANPRPMADVSSNLDLDHLFATAINGNTIELTPVDRILLGIG